MPLKPQNLIQAAEADLKRSLRNAEIAMMAKHQGGTGHYEQFAFHRDHVRRADTARDLLVLALMNPNIKTAKPNTKMIYRDGMLLFQAVRLCDVAPGTCAAPTFSVST